jgi:hypothetical protein
VKDAAAVLAILGILGCQGCLAVAVGSVAVSTVETAGKVTAATVGATGRLAASAVKSSSGMTADAAAKLSRPGSVVAVEAGSGSPVELAWRPGLDLPTAAGPGNSGRYRSARVFRHGAVVTVTLPPTPAQRGALQPGDVVEFHR